MRKILVIDDDKSICESLRLYLAEEGYEVGTALTGEEGLKWAATGAWDVVILDIFLSDVDGLDILHRLKAAVSDASVIMITAFHDMPTTVRAMKLGAVEYIHKPIDIDELDAAIRRVLKRKAETRGKDRHSIALSNQFQERGLIGKSRAMKEIFKTIGIVSQSKTTVLIEGESGTGKELIARAIHEHTDPARPFISINCSAIVETLLESELFGHEKGAFTGASYRKLGKFELANSGTLLLDEIGDMAQAQTTARPIKRYLLVYFPCGVARAFWPPDGEGAGSAWTLSALLEPLLPYKQYLQVISNGGQEALYNAGENPNPSHSLYCAPSFSCTVPDEREPILGGPTVDQILAPQIATPENSFESLQLGCSTMNSNPDGRHPAITRSVSWKTTDQPLYKEVNPQKVFDQLVAQLAPSGK